MPSLDLYDVIQDRLLLHAAILTFELEAADTPTCNGFCGSAEMVAFVLGAFSLLWMIGGGIILMLKALVREEYSIEGDRLNYRHLTVSSIGTVGKVLDVGTVVIRRREK